MAKFSLVLAVLAIAAFLSSCGGGNLGTLQSITVSPSSASGAGRFVAAGTYSNGAKVSPLPVNWFVILGAVDPAPGYQLTAAPFSQPCAPGQSGSFLVTAFAPQNPKAPSSGSMSTSVWLDLIHASRQAEGGFVGASAQLNCP
jgi:hypothetical protein